MFIAFLFYFILFFFKTIRSTFHRNNTVNNKIFHLLAERGEITPTPNGAQIIE